MDIFVQLALAIKHVHDRKIIHRDIKTENIFLSSHKRIVKLGDFGIAKVLENTLQQARTSIGTPYYLSPEICQGKLYNFKSDMWSLGVVLYELCALRCPFAAANMKGLMLCISKGSYSPIPASFSPELRKLIADMLNLNPKLRPSINDLLRRPILQQRISKLIEVSVLRSEFSHTVLHGQHYSKAKCPMPSASPESQLPHSPLIDAERQKVAALKHVGHIADNHIEQFKANIRGVSDAKVAAISKPQPCQAIAIQRDKLLGDLISEKLEREKRDKVLARVLLEKRQAEENFERERREKAAIIAEKAERERRDREVAKILAEKRDRELARQKGFHQHKVDKQAEAAIAAVCPIDRAQEDRAKQKRQQILALEDFRQRQAKQWLGGAVQAVSPPLLPADPCLVRKEVAVAAVFQNADIAAAKRLWSVKSPSLNSADEVKARGAAQKIEEQQKYEQALAIARKQAFMERLAAEDRRQRELHSALQAEEQIIKTVSRSASKAAAVSVSDSSLPSVCDESVPTAAHLTSPKVQLDDGNPLHGIFVAASVLSSDVNVSSNSEAVCDFQYPDCERLEGFQISELDESELYVVLIAFNVGSSCIIRSKAEIEEEQSLREIVGELMHLTLDPSCMANDHDDDDSDACSVFEKIEGIRIQLESQLGTKNFLQLYELARDSQDGSSGELESQIDSICSQDADLIFNSLVQLLNFESEVYGS